ncbi:uncharacterized protein J8A68_005158 [[Candida] subhashii]|uniref:Nudix hydrolase domain-containing protein n=1 Tax=[Candida] subhashii TaxID=561895 RepID=A0A8J5UJQ9_9ASCO|nr:uncharacterized protein J8A68_005158 [[Candida] subhashii]KAG7661366.1 hypothetical protein J8A68_005158 [[Candida] subhashii]
MSGSKYGDQRSFIEVINDVDSFVLNDSFYQLITHDNTTCIGYISSTIANYFIGFDKYFKVNHQLKTITIDSSFDTFETRNIMIADIANQWRSIKELDEQLNKGWRNELYTAYYPSTEPYFLVERSFSVLLGVVTYGVHLNGYIPANKSSNGKLKMWIPRRSPTKPTYPGMLDNTVAGGLGYPHGIWETVIKECFEEAGLSQEFIESHAKCVGVTSYLYKTKDGRVQPEVEYTYDIEFDNEFDVIPHPEDGEAEYFKLMDIDEILERLYNKEFKPNCGLIIVDFLIRHGLITPENEPHYFEIVNRCHRNLPFPTR